MIWLPGKAGLIKDTLRSQNPFPDTALGLLREVIYYELKSNPVIDLSSFNLTSDHIVQLFNTMQFPPVETVNISHCRLITDLVSIRAILTAMPTLKNLNLLDTGISADAIRTLIIEEHQLLKCLSSLTHPALLRIKNPITHPNGFSCVAYRYTPASAYLPIWTPAMVVQSLVDFFSPLTSGNEDAFLLESSIFGSMALQTAFSSLRDENQKWGERRVPLVAASSLAGLDGAGWMFVYHGMTSAYAFVHFDSERLKDILAGESDNKDDSARTSEGDKEGFPSDLWTFYDLQGFLKQMADEGRPLPSETLINRLETIFAKLGDDNSGTSTHPLAAMLGRLQTTTGMRSKSAHVFEYNEFAKFRLEVSRRDLMESLVRG